MENRKYEPIEVNNVLQQLIEQIGAERVLETLKIVMSTDALTNALADVCKDNGLDFDELVNR